MDKPMLLMLDLFHVHHIQSIEELAIVQLKFYHEVVHLILNQWKKNNKFNRTIKRLTKMSNGVGFE
jgi:hypothetical protein